MGEDGWWEVLHDRRYIADLSFYFCMSLDDTVDAQYVRLEIQDSETPMVISKHLDFWVSRQWQPRINMVYGAQIQWNDPTGRGSLRWN